MVDMEIDGAATLGYLLTRTSMSLRAKVATGLTPEGLTLPEYICMAILFQTPGLSNSELARQAAVTRQAMNAVLQRLQEVGYISRPDTACQGRSLPARLTEAGVGKLSSARKVVVAAENEVMVDLDTKERKELKRLLTRCMPATQ